MRAMDPGHVYALSHLDSGQHPMDQYGVLRFVKRIGEKFPGNRAPGHAGATSQEVIRALIDRAHYVNAQAPDIRNDTVVFHLREALRWPEIRAADRRKDPVAGIQIASLEMEALENAPVCTGCGHIACSTDHSKAKQ